MSSIVIPIDQASHPAWAAILRAASCGARRRRRSVRESVVAVLARRGRREICGSAKTAATEKKEGTSLLVRSVWKVDTQIGACRPWAGRDFGLDDSISLAALRTIVATSPRVLLLSRRAQA